MQPISPAQSEDEGDELLRLIATYGELALWEKLRSLGWSYSITESLEFITRLFVVHTKLDSAYNLARALFPVVVRQPQSPDYPGPLFWAFRVCDLIRIVHLSDSSERA